MAVLTPTRRPRPSQNTGAAPGAHARPSGRNLPTLAFFAGYVVLLGAGVARHEPWVDEAQAWLLARDTGLLELFTTWLPREGSPGLWHTLLLAPARLGMAYETLNVVSASLGAAAAFLVLRRSPYPLPAKLLLPFSFFLFYQYAVVGRSYSLLAPLVFGLALAHPDKEQKVAPYAVLLGLLANATAHGFVIAASLTGLHSLDLVKRRNSLESKLKIRHLAALAGLAVVFGLVALQLRRSQHSGFVEKQYRFDFNSFISTASELLNESTTGVGWASALILGVSLFWFWRRKTLLVYLVPATALLLFFSVVYSSPWHQGILTLVWLFAMWLSFQAGRADDGKPEDAAGTYTWGRMAAGTALLAVALVQVGWAVNAFRYDHHFPYSGSKAAAAFIKDSDLQKETVYTTGFASMALQPYFDRNIFSNFREGRPESFWDWSRRKPIVEDPAHILRRKPDLIVLSVKFPDSEKQPRLFPGYRVIACFPGGLAWKEGPIEPDSYLLLAPASRPAQTFFPRDAHPVSLCPAKGSGN